MKVRIKAIHSRPASLPGNFPARQAFTLVEMLLVLILISLLASGAVVSLRGRKDTYALQVSTHDLAKAMELAVSQAKLKQSTHRVVFNDPRQTYRVEKATTDSALEFTPAQGQAGMGNSLIEGVRISRVWYAENKSIPLPSSFEFYAGGGGFYGRIELVNRTGDSKTIEVMPQTGQVHVLE